MIAQPIKNIADKAGKYAKFSGIINWRGTTGMVENACFILVEPPLANTINFLSGVWLFGCFHTGVWCGGVWRYGVFRNSFWLGGEWAEGIWNNSEKCCAVTKDGDRITLSLMNGEKHDILKPQENKQ